MGFIVKRQENETQAEFESKVEKFENNTRDNLLGFKEPFSNRSLPTSGGNESIVESVPIIRLTGEA